MHGLRRSDRATAQLLERLFLDAVTQGERVVSMLRIAFCTLIVARFLLGDSVDEEVAGYRALVELPAIGVAIGFSIWILLATRRAAARPSWLYYSVALDAVVCFGALIPGVLWPWPLYDGILHIPDTAAILIIVFTSGFRLVPGVALLSGALNLGSGLVLVLVDRALQPSRLAYGWSEVALGAIYVVAATLLAVFVGTRTRRLVDMGAAESVAAERARHSLGLVLQDHHDVRSLLSSATVNADMLARDLEKTEGRARLASLTRALNEDLEQLGDYLGTVRERAYGELLTLEDTAPVALAGVVNTLLPMMERRFPTVKFQVGELPAAEVSIAGGARGLDRILLNLLVNASEGDGTLRASTVWVDAEATPDRLTLSVRDDGPGLPEPVLAAGRRAGVTTKLGGSGLGLLLVSRIVEASGGTLEVQNLTGGGALAQVTLPCRTD